MIRFVSHDPIRGEIESILPAVQIEVPLANPFPRKIKIRRNTLRRFTATDEFTRRLNSGRAKDPRSMAIVLRGGLLA